MDITTNAIEYHGDSIVKTLAKMREYALYLIREIARELATILIKEILFSQVNILHFWKL